MTLVLVVALCVALSRFYGWVLVSFHPYYPTTVQNRATDNVSTVVDESVSRSYLPVAIIINDVLSEMKVRPRKPKDQIAVSSLNWTEKVQQTYLLAPSRKKGKAKIITASGVDRGLWVENGRVAKGKQLVSPYLLGADVWDSVSQTHGLNTYEQGIGDT